VLVDPEGTDVIDVDKVFHQRLPVATDTVHGAHGALPAHPEVTAGLGHRGAVLSHLATYLHRSCSSDQGVLDQFALFAPQWPSLRRGGDYATAAS